MDSAHGNKGARSEAPTVIIGNSAASIFATTSFRKLNNNAPLHIYSEEEWPAYYRPLLSKTLNSNIAKERFFVKPDEWYEELGVQLHLRTRVEQVDRTNKRLRLGDGSWRDYSKLVLATGARCFVPPIPNHTLPGVFVLRSYGNALELGKAAKSARSGVVLGGGLLGLETAWELARMGLQMTIIELAPRVLPMQLDKVGSARLAQVIESTQVNLITGDSVESFHGDTHLKMVRTAAGHEIPCDIAVVSAGIRSNIELAQEAGLVTDLGVVVDSHMQTNDSDIFAAGDVAQYGPRVEALWPVAQEMGKVAGANCAGDDLSYIRKIRPVLFSGFGINLFSLGDTGVRTENKYETVTLQDTQYGDYGVFTFLDDQLTGVSLMGHSKKAFQLSSLLAKGISRKQLLDITGAHNSQID